MYPAERLALRVGPRTGGTCPREGDVAGNRPPGSLNPLITAAHQQHEPEGEPDKGDRNPLFAAEAVVADAEHSDEIVPQLIR